MDYFEPYGGGSIPMEARSAFDGTPSRNDFSAPPSRSTRRPPPRSGADISDIDDIERYSDYYQQSNRPSRFDDDDDDGFYDHQRGNNRNRPLSQDNRQARDRRLDQMAQFDRDRDDMRHAATRREPPNRSNSRSRPPQQDRYRDDYEDNDYNQGFDRNRRNDFEDFDRNSNRNRSNRNNFDDFDDFDNFDNFDRSKQRPPPTSDRFRDVSIESAMEQASARPGSLFGAQLDHNAPQFALFGRNKDLEKHLFEPSDEPLFIPFDKTFDEGFNELEEGYNSALKQGMFNERVLDGEDNMAAWGGIKPPPIKKPTAGSLAFDDSDFTSDDELDALYAKLQHISTGTPPSPGKMTPAWDGHQVPKLSDLGLNPADAGYTDEEIKKIFGDLQFIDTKISKGEKLTKEEEEFELPMTEDDLLDRLARIEAKKEHKLKTLDRLDHALRVCFY